MDTWTLTSHWYLTHSHIKLLSSWHLQRESNTAPSEDSSDASVRLWASERLLMPLRSNGPQCTAYFLNICTVCVCIYIYTEVNVSCSFRNSRAVCSPRALPPRLESRKMNEWKWEHLMSLRRLQTSSCLTSFISWEAALSISLCVQQERIKAPASSSHQTHLCPSVCPA